MSHYKIPVEFEFIAEEEFDGPEGFFATGDDAEDTRMCEEIRDRLNRGDEAAWFCAKVICRGPADYIGTDYLGGCSYDSFEDFKKDAYYESMCDEAYRSMIEAMKADVRKGEAAKRILAKYGIEA